MEKEKLPEPGFLEQAFALVDESYAEEKEYIENPDYGHGIRPRDHKLLIKVMDLHLKVTKLEVNDLNNIFHDKIIADVNEVIGEQWIRVLDRKLSEFENRIDGKLSAIALDIMTMKNDMSEIKIEVNGLKKTASSNQKSIPNSPPVHWWHLPYRLHLPVSPMKR